MDAGMVIAPTGSAVMPVMVIAVLDSVKVKVGSAATSCKYIAATHPLAPERKFTFHQVFSEAVLGPSVTVPLAPLFCDPIGELVGFGLRTFTPFSVH